MKLHLQLFATYSKLQNHEAALAQSQSALRRSNNIINCALRACQEHLYRHKAMNLSPVHSKQIKNQQYILLDSPHYQLFHGLVLKAIPILQFLDEKQPSYPKLSISNVPEVKFEDLLKIQPLEFETIVRGPEIMEELERDLMLEKIIYHIATHFFVATQLMKGRTEGYEIETKILIKRAWKVCRCFFPEKHSIYVCLSGLWEKCRDVGLSRVRSVSRTKPPTKLVRSDARSISSKRFKTACKRLNDTYKEIQVKSHEQILTPLRRKTIRKLKKIK
jgi:hypothetical protein